MNLRKLLAGIMISMILAPSGIHANAMEISQKGVDFICSSEGYHETCYWDYQQSSIGYGTKCESSSVQPHKTGLHTITEEEAKTAMQTGIASNYAPKVIRQTSDVNLNQNQFDALVSLAYNCGGGQNRIYNSPLVKYLRGELTEAQARTQYANYLVTAGGTWNKGLYNRRVKEANFFFEEVNCKPAYANVALQGDRNIFMTGEDVLFYVSSDNADIYYLTVYHEEEILFTETLKESNLVYVHSFNETGAYSVSCSAGNMYGVTQGEKINFEVFESVQDNIYKELEFLTGDINLDGEIDIQDVKLLQDYLQCRANFTKEQFCIADMNQDGICNIFDFNILKYTMLGVN
ncbi:MAG: glycoside hydrolase family protein [Oscillospiraceae bacterium]|nr:glycoside hydrolase family protein [Oscillospiraceae bacterium]